MSPTPFFSVLPLLKDETGHVYSYNLYVQQAAESSGYLFSALIPCKHGLSKISSSWKPVLAQEKGRIKAVRKMIQPLKHVFFLKKNTPKNSLFFLEHFGPFYLWVFSWFFFFFSPKKVLLVLRHHPREMGYKKFFYLNALRRLKKGKKTVFLTDSTLLQESFFHLLQTPIQLLPVPHTWGKTQTTRKTQNLSLWWPGGDLRQDKGYKIAVALSQKLPKDGSWKMFLAKSFAPLVNSQNVEFVDNCLTEKNYQKLFTKADCVILPYQAFSYRFRTSGIFIEAVTQQTFVFVTEDTWMAEELKKYDLTSLIIDWETPDFFSYASSIMKEESIKVRFQKMSARYRDYHNPASFFQELQKHFS